MARRAVVQTRVEQINQFVLKGQYRSRNTDDCQNGSQRKAQQSMNVKQTLFPHGKHPALLWLLSTRRC